MNMSFGRSHRYNSGLLCRLLLLAVLLMASDAGANPESQGLSCPSADEVRFELAIRKDKLIKLKTGLEAFITGKRSADIPLNALFMTDLTDADAVAHRLEEVQQETSRIKDASKSQDPFLDCALSMDGLRASAEEILALQLAVAGLRLQFLTLPPEKRAVILNPQMEATAQANIVTQLQEEHRSAIEEQKQAVKSLEREEKQVLAGGDGAAGDLIAERAELERTRSELTALQLKWVSELEQQTTFYQETSEKLAEIAKFLLQPESSKRLKTEYEKSVTIWRTLVDNTNKVVTSRHALAIPDLPEYPEKLLNKIGDTQEARQYADAYAEIKAFRQSLQDKIGARLQESVDLHYRVLLQSGEIRSQLLNLLLERGDHSPLALSPDLFQDIRREFKIVPHRWTATFYLKMLDVRRRLSQGWEGLAETAANFTALIVFLTIPWLIWVGTQHLSTKLNHLRIKLVRQSRTHPSASNLALAIQKIMPYSRWLVMLLTVYIAQKLLVLTVFAELALLLPYIRYYIYYRLFRQAMQCDFLWVNQLIRASKLWNLRRQVDIATKTLGLSAFLIFSFLTAIESLIRRGLIYHLATRAMFDLGLLFAMGFAYQWRGVIGAGLARLIPGALGGYVAKLCNSRWGLIFSIPAFFVLILLLLVRQLGNWGSHFEVTKRIAAEVFRYQLESTIDKAGSAEFTPLPLEYRKFFPLAGIATPEQLVTPAIAGLNEIYTLLKDWSQETSLVHSLAVVGHKGTGKTCLLDYLERNTPTEHIIRTAVSAKLTSRNQVLEFFGDILNVPLTENAYVLRETVSVRPKTLVVVDDAHNLFLSARGGFEGYNTLLELISHSSHKLFWCLGFNHHAWSYLNSVYARHQYIGSVLRLTPWPEQAIQDLILSMHASTAFRLSYDDIIQAAGSQSNSEHITYIENRFFSLLRQQSRGNPRLAIYLWLSSLRLVGDKSLRVGLPEEPETVELSNLTEDALFVFAGIARHENLTLSQVVAVTQLPEGVVRHVLDMGVRLKLLDCNENRIYRLAVLYQYPLINYLQAKQCLYE